VVVIVFTIIKRVHIRVELLLYLLRSDRPGLPGNSDAVGAKDVGGRGKIVIAIYIHNNSNCAYARSSYFLSTQPRPTGFTREI